MWIVLGGPDGVGKTTTAHALADLFECDTAYFHFRPSLLSRMETAPPQGSQKLPKDRHSISFVASVLRILRAFAYFWLAYIVRIRPAVKRGTLVIGDRWCYSYFSQPYSVKYAGPGWLAGLLIRLTPQPDLVAVLKADAGLIHARKDELTIPEIASELSTWARLPAGNVLAVDASQPPTAVAVAIRRHLRHLPLR